jgi:hypothetical protein
MRHKAGIKSLAQGHSVRGKATNNVVRAYTELHNLKIITLSLPSTTNWRMIQEQQNYNLIELALKKNHKISMEKIP